MGKITGFLEIEREDRTYEPASDRIRHFKEFMIPLSEQVTRDQAARCMNCGIPYCMGTGALTPGTALTLAQGLERLSAVSRVYYPGLASHPQHDLARGAQVR